MKEKSPYTYPHRSRKDMVEYLAGIGGHNDRDCRWPIDFIVSTHFADLSVENLWELAKREGHAGDDLLHKQSFWEEYESIGDETLWTTAVEDAARGLLEGDCCCSKGDKGEAASLELRGRSGKHLAVMEFAGFQLRGHSPESLREELLLQTDLYGSEVSGEARLRRGYEWAVPTSLVEGLYRYVRRCEVDFTSRKASDEVEYMAAVFLSYQAEEGVWRMREAQAIKNSLLLNAKIVKEAIDQKDEETLHAWRALATAAGVDVTEIE